MFVHVLGRAMGDDLQRRRKKKKKEEKEKMSIRKQREETLSLLCSRRGSLY
jgi:hypothetical protein